MKKDVALTSTCKNLLCQFINDEMNKGRIDSISSSIVLSFGDKFDKDIELWVFDDNLLYSCINHKPVTQYMGYCIFYQGEIDNKYLSELVKDNAISCTVCDSLLQHIPDKTSVIYDDYDGSAYKVYRAIKTKKFRIEKVPGG